MERRRQLSNLMYTLRYALALVVCICGIFPQVGTICITVASAESGASPKVAIALPLTGDLAEYGVAVRNGIQLAVSEYPDRFAHIELIYEDNRYDAKLAVTIFKKLQASGINVLYSWGEIPLNAIAPLVERAGFPVAAYSLDFSPARGSRLITLTSNDPRSLVAPLVERLRSKGFKRFGVVKMEDPYINSCLEGFRSSLREGESVEIISTVLPGDYDMKPHALAIKHAKVDAVGIYVYPGQISTLYRQLHALGLKIPTFGTDVFESRTEIESAGSAMEGAWYPNFGIPEAFSARYREQYKNDSHIPYAYTGYVWAVITGKIFADPARIPSPEEIVTHYRSESAPKQTDFDIRRSSDGVFFYQYPVVVKRISHGWTETE